MKNYKYKKIKTAFTMLELVMVIVVLGILASLALPRIERNRTQEGADAILSNIRYTQHMALSDYRHNFNVNRWQRSFWQIQFYQCASSSGMFMRLGSDQDYGGPTADSPSGDIGKKEAATDMSTGLPMYWNTPLDCTNGGDGTVSENIFLKKKFGITKVTQSGGCTAKHIGFDHLGRPHTGFSSSSTPDYSSYMKTTCAFKFTVEGADDFSIEIAPETGYAHIVTQEAS